MPNCRPHDLPISLAWQEPCYPKNLPTKVGAHGIRHQLRTKVRSMKFHVLCHQLRVETRSMNGFSYLINHVLKPVA